MARDGVQLGTGKFADRALRCPVNFNQQSFPAFPPPKLSMVTLRLALHSTSPHRVRFSLSNKLCYHSNLERLPCLR